MTITPNPGCHGPVSRSEIRVIQLALEMFHLGGPPSRAMTLFGGNANTFAALMRAVLARRLGRCFFRGCPVDLFQLFQHVFRNRLLFDGTVQAAQLPAQLTLAPECCRSTGGRCYSEHTHAL